MLQAAWLLSLVGMAFAAVLLVLVGLLVVWLVTAGTQLLGS